MVGGFFLGQRPMKEKLSFCSKGKQISGHLQLTARSRNPRLQDGPESVPNVLSRVGRFLRMHLPCRRSVGVDAQTNDGQHIAMQHKTGSVCQQLPLGNEDCRRSVSVGPLCNGWQTCVTQEASCTGVEVQVIGCGNVFQNAFDASPSTMSAESNHALSWCDNVSEN